MDGSVKSVRKDRRRLLIALAFVAFVSLGLPDTILGVGWPFIRATFGKPIDSLAFLLLGGVSGYLTSSFFSGTIVRYLGVGKLLLLSSLAVCIALAGNSMAPAFGWMVGLSVLSGLGAGAIDAGINAFGAKRFSSRVMNWLHASWGVGATIGPATMTALLTVHFSWRVGYGVLSCALGALALLFLLTMRMWEDDASETPHDVTPHASMREALRVPTVCMQALLFFVYCGIESTAGQLIFSLFTEVRGIRVGVAGSTIAGYWFALTLGRIVFGQAATFLSHTSILRLGMALSILASILIWWAPVAWVGIAGTVLLGFGLAPIYPTLISDTPARVGVRYSAHAVGFQVSAAAVGIAIFPGLVSGVAQRTGLECIGIYFVAATLALALLNEATACKNCTNR